MTFNPHKVGVKHVLAVNFKRLNQAVFEHPGQPKYIPFIYLHFPKVDVCKIIFLKKSKTGSDFQKITVHFSRSKNTYLFRRSLDAQVYDLWIFCSYLFFQSLISKNKVYFNFFIFHKNWPLWMEGLGKSLFCRFKIVWWLKSLWQRCGILRDLAGSVWRIFGYPTPRR